MVHARLITHTNFACRVAEGRADAKPFEVGQLVRIGSKEMEVQSPSARLISTEHG